jgi:Zn-dependent peptidase ImmA (M78 family)
VSRIASNILAAHWDGKLPVDLQEIAAGMGVFLFSSKQLGSLSGKIELVNERPHVTINTNESLVRQRFTIAHELGHFALGHLSDGQPQFRDPAANFSTGASSALERQANAFAAELLMPQRAVEYAVNEKQMLGIAELAGAFHVSQAAMTYRLQELGMLASVL